MMSNNLTTRIPPRSAVLLQPPRLARHFSWTLFVLMILLPIGMVFLPWYQNINAPGRVIAYDPELRMQNIEAPQDGRIYRIYAKENDRVGQGQLLVSIQDPDPDIRANVREAQKAIEERKRAAELRVANLNDQMLNLKQAQTSALLAADKRIEVTRQSLVSAEQMLAAATQDRKLAEFNFEMEQTMLRDGLTPRFNFLTAETRLLNSRFTEESRKAARDAAKEAVAEAKAMRERTKAEFDSNIQSIQANINSAKAEVEAARRELAEQNIRISRLNTLDVHAPRDGVVHRVLANAGSGGTFVKQGDVLMVFIPDIPTDSKRVVEVFVDGNDAPQVMELLRQRIKRSPEDRIKARVQFEGYPVIHIIGWPNLAVGTFGGLVQSIDPHDDGKGKFRVLIEPDPDDRPWPSDFAVRQGARVQSWLLLNRVSIGFELWRRFNAFPPVMAEPDEAEKEKPAKVRLPK